MNHSADHNHGAWNMDQLSRLARPERHEMMPISTVLSHVRAESGSTVVDVGAGLGWLTFPLASLVGPSGRVVAIDPSTDGIQAITLKADQEHYKQVEARVARAEDTGLADECADCLVWHTMYHDVENRGLALSEMYRIAKSGAYWVIVDWDKRPMDVGPPLSVRMTAEEVEMEVHQVGFRTVERWQGGPVTWGLTMSKP